MATFHNAQELLLSLSTETPKLVFHELGDSGYGWVDLNGIKLLRCSKDGLEVNLTDLCKGFKWYLKSVDSVSSGIYRTVFVRNDPESILKDLFYVEVSGKGTGDYKGKYVSTEILSMICYQIGKAGSMKWFKLHVDWKSSMGVDIIYLIQERRFQGTHIWKFGKTDDGHIGPRLSVYNHNQKIAKVVDPYVIVVAICYIENTSLAEQELGIWFEGIGDHYNDDRELFEILDKDYFDYKKLQAFFKKVLMEEFETCGEDAFEFYDYGSHTYPENAYQELS